MSLPRRLLSGDPEERQEQLRCQCHNCRAYCLLPFAPSLSFPAAHLFLPFTQDIDFASSHLCGYLRIRGLTDDWPELTTYFDAEIIGSRYGFLTRNWGATEQEDMVHWARFPAFRHVRHELKKPHLTMKDADRGAVFMRWKEKFLVPDHRVQDISGASFAGQCHGMEHIQPFYTPGRPAPCFPLPSMIRGDDKFADTAFVLSRQAFTTFV